MKELKLFQKLFFLLLAGFSLCTLQACSDDEEDTLSEDTLDDLQNELTNTEWSVTWQGYYANGNPYEDYNGTMSWYLYENGAGEMEGGVPFQWAVIANILTISYYNNDSLQIESYQIVSNVKNSNEWAITLRRDMEDYEPEYDPAYAFFYCTYNGEAHKGDDKNKDDLESLRKKLSNTQWSVHAEYICLDGSLNSDPDDNLPTYMRWELYEDGTGLVSNRVPFNWTLVSENTLKVTWYYSADYQETDVYEIISNERNGDDWYVTLRNDDWPAQSPDDVAYSLYYCTYEGEAHKGENGDEEDDPVVDPTPTPEGQGEGHVYVDDNHATLKYAYFYTETWEEYSSEKGSMYNCSMAQMCYSTVDLLYYFANPDKVKSGMLFSCAWLDFEDRTTIPTGRVTDYEFEFEQDAELIWMFNDNTDPDEPTYTTSAPTHIFYCTDWDEVQTPINIVHENDYHSVEAPSMTMLASGYGDDGGISNDARKTTASFQFSGTYTDVSDLMGEEETRAIKVVKVTDPAFIACLKRLHTNRK